VPRLLSNDQKEHHVSVCTELKEQARDDPFISKVTTGDRSRVLVMTETKQQLLQSPNSLQPKKGRQVRSNVKPTLTVFF
jgi:hypothetical protein